MDRDQIELFRSFNRTFTQCVGALDQDFLGRGRPLGESRLLFEIGHGGADVRALRARLGLDSGYMSRLLRTLEAQDLIEVEAKPSDRRARRAVPTARGKREVETLDRLAEDFAAGLLSGLSERQRTRLTEALQTAEALVRAAMVEILPEAPASPEARWCFEQYFTELGQRFDAGFDPAQSISAEAHELTPPAGLLVLARLGGQPLGCGALKVKSDGIGEVKRMWVSPEARGLGLGARILATLEQQAGELGLETLRLETNRHLKEAQTLYKKAGYREVPAFNDEPYAHHWFEKRLDAKSA